MRKGLKLRRFNTCNDSIRAGKSRPYKNHGFRLISSDKHLGLYGLNRQKDKVA
jgi:hypothetical protein